MESSLPAGEQDPSGTPPDPFPAFSGSNRTQGSLSLFWCFRTKSKGGTRKQGRSTLANTAVAAEDAGTGPVGTAAFPARVALEAAFVAEGRPQAPHTGSVVNFAAPRL